MRILTLLFAFVGTSVSEIVKIEIKENQGAVDDFVSYQEEKEYLLEINNPTYLR